MCIRDSHRIMIRPHGAVLPTRMGIVEILTELSKAVCQMCIRDRILTPIIGGLIGAYLARGIFKKHFKKAGMI